MPRIFEQLYTFFLNRLLRAASRFWARRLSTCSLVFDPGLIKHFKQKSKRWRKAHTYGDRRLTPDSINEQIREIIHTITNCYWLLKLSDKNTRLKTTIHFSWERRTTCIWTGFVHVVQLILDYQLDYMKKEKTDTNQRCNIPFYLIGRFRRFLIELVWRS